MTITWDSINEGSGLVLSNEFLTAEISSSQKAVRASEGKKSGKWYLEINVIVSGQIAIGVVNEKYNLNTIGWNSENSVYYRANGYIVPPNTAYGKAISSGDTISVLIDADKKKVSFMNNGVKQGSTSINLFDFSLLYPSVTSTHVTVANTSTVNFGATPFKYPIPDGYKPYQSSSNKTFILSTDGYKKYDEGSPEIVSENTIPAMTSNTSPSGTVSVSSFLQAGYEAWRAFDGVLSHGGAWISSKVASESSPEWISYRFEGKKRIGLMKIKTRDNNLFSTQSIKDFKIQGLSEVGGDYTDLKIIKGETWTVAGEEKTYTLDIVDDFIEYRIYITATNGTTAFTITEIEMYEVIPATPPSWKTVSPTLPPLSQFQEEGVDDLSVFDRKVQQILGSPQQMTNEVLGEGKVFKGSVNLKKIFDLRKLEVK